MVSDPVEERSELLGVPDPHRVPGGGAELGRVGKGGDVADDASLALGVGERLVDHLVDRVDGLGCQPATPLISRRKLRVQAVEVLGGEALERDASYGWDHVKVDGAAVGVERARP